MGKEIKLVSRFKNFCQGNEIIDKLRDSFLPQKSGHKLALTERIKKIRTPKHFLRIYCESMSYRSPTSALNIVTPIYLFFLVTLFCCYNLTHDAFASSSRQEFTGNILCCFQRCDCWRKASRRYCPCLYAPNIRLTMMCEFWRRLHVGALSGLRKHLLSPIQERPFKILCRITFPLTFSKLFFKILGPPWRSWFGLLPMLGEKEMEGLTLQLERKPRELSAPLPWSLVIQRQPSDVAETFLPLPPPLTAIPPPHTHWSLSIIEERYWYLIQRNTLPCRARRHAVHLSVCLSPLPRPQSPRNSLSYHLAMPSQLVPWHSFFIYLFRQYCMPWAAKQEGFTYMKQVNPVEQ